MSPVFAVGSLSRRNALPFGAGRDAASEPRGLLHGTDAARPGWGRRRHASGWSRSPSPGAAGALPWRQDLHQSVC